MKNALSQLAAPPSPMLRVDFPFQMLLSKYFTYSGMSYLVVDRYLGWPVVVQYQDESSEELVRILRGLFCCNGSPEELAKGGATVYVLARTHHFMAKCGTGCLLCTKLSPAQVLYARKLRHTVPCKPGHLRFRKDWLMNMRELWLKDSCCMERPLVSILGCWECCQ